MTDRYWIWTAIIGFFVVVRLLRFLSRGARGSKEARLNAAAERILKSRGAPPPADQQAGGRKPPPAPAKGAHGQLRNRPSAQAQKQAARVVMATPSVAVIRRGPETAPNTPVIQRRR